MGPASEQRESAPVASDEFDDASAMATTSAGAASEAVRLLRKELEVDIGFRFFLLLDGMRVVLL